MKLVVIVFSLVCLSNLTWGSEMGTPKYFTKSTKTFFGECVKRYESTEVSGDTDINFEMCDDEVLERAYFLKKKAFKSNGCWVDEKEFEIHERQEVDGSGSATETREVLYFSLSYHCPAK